MRPHGSVLRLQPLQAMRNIHLSDFVSRATGLILSPDKVGVALLSRSDPFSQSDGFASGAPGEAARARKEVVRQMIFLFFIHISLNLKQFIV